MAGDAARRRAAMKDGGKRRAAGEGGTRLSAEAVVRNPKGLHARASAQFVKRAEAFAATVRVSREGHTVPGTSIMGLMMLAAGPGDSILIEASGPEAQTALEALVALVESGFDEAD